MPIGCRSRAAVPGRARGEGPDPRATTPLHDRADPCRHIEVRGQIVATETGPPAIDLAHLAFDWWTGSPVPRPAAGERILLRLRADHIHRKDSR
ncbi:hypothetical protein [Candidatus Frankia nodulisporulans]|uniref:hypothetical protein n=1 Tax=Candidatus Frankia nodulisporulans TaxID=2060052 RepID=UPI0013D311A8|nr:hypothetical protein [Candidatus Frankia nodulisporulans]